MKKILIYLCTSLLFCSTVSYTSCSDNKVAENDNNEHSGNNGNDDNDKKSSLFIGSWIDGFYDENTKSYEYETLTFYSDGTFRILYQKGNANNCQEVAESGTYNYSIV